METDKYQDWKTIREIFAEMKIDLSENQCWDLGTIISRLVSRLKPGLPYKKKENKRVYPPDDQLLISMIKSIGMMYLNIQ